MGDVRELARECVRLWPHEFVKSKGSALAECMRLDRHGLEAQQDDYFTGPIRHAVEVECERRGWSWSWHMFEPNSYGFDAELHDLRRVCEDGGTALECALHTLKWLLENPSEVTDG